tara:strand:+ start:1137 stop:1427 length:291 start_codon:yes stop_codon:yes gene_type:complete
MGTLAALGSGKHLLLNKIVIGAFLTAVFVGLAQKMRITDEETGYDRCVRQVEKAELQCRETGRYPNSTSGPVDVIDLCKTYAWHDKERCAAPASKR